MAEKRIIEYEAASELANDDWLLIDGVTEGTRKARPNVVTAELGTQVTNLASTVSGLTQVAMGHEQSFAPDYDESASYDVGDLVMQYHGLYKCTAPTTGTWDAGKWERTEVSEQLAEAGKVDDVTVNGESVVVNRVAEIDLTGMQADIDSKVADVTVGGESIVNEDHVFEMDNFISKASIPSGAISTFGNAMALPMPSLSVSIEAVQSGTGDPSPTNVRPISGWSAVNVYDTSINVWDEEWEVGAISNSNGDNYALAERVRSKNYISVKPNTPYYLYLPNTYSSARIACYDKDKTYLGQAIGWLSVNNNTVFTTPSNTFHIRFVIVKADETYNNDISINYPSTDTEYHAYNGSTYTLDLDGTRYGGTLDVVSGELVVDRVGVDFGDLTWNGSLSAYHYYTTLSIPYKWANNTQFICSKYKFDGRGTGGNYYGVSGTFRYWYSEGGTPVYEIYVCDETHTFSSFTEVKEYLSGTMLVYELATPIEVQLTPTAVKSLLGTNNLWADSGDIQSGQYFTNSVPSNVYSTDEKAVGVWIDGRTVYEKTIDLGSTQNYEETGWQSIMAHQNKYALVFNGMMINPSGIGYCVDIACNDTTNLEVYLTHSTQARYLKFQYVKAN